MFKALTAALLLSSAIAAFAQTVPPPIAPELIIYRHWPEQFVQWIGTELPYTMIELYVDPGSGPTPLYEVVLTERAIRQTSALRESTADGRAGQAPGRGCISRHHTTRPSGQHRLGGHLPAAVC